MELIKVSDLIEALKNLTNSYTTIDVRSVIDSIPTVDAVEVVRCEECIYFKPVKGICGICKKDCESTSGVFDTDYCSCGERKAD